MALLSIFFFFYVQAEARVNTSPVTLNVSTGNIVITSTGYKVGNSSTETAYTGEYIIEGRYTGSAGYSHHISVTSGNHTITLNGVYIEFWNGAHSGNRFNPGTGPFSINGNSKVTLNLKGTNTLIGGVFRAGLNVTENAELTIGGDGTLNATGGICGAGIGGDNEQNAGTVIINSGTINAYGRREFIGCGAGIGGGRDGNGGTVIINGGYTYAHTDDWAAGIGGGSYRAGGAVYILGGTVVADAGTKKGIGGSNNSGNGTFATTKDGKTGNAYIVANSIGDQTNKGSWTGVIFEGNEGKMYGDVTIETDAEVPAGKTLIVDKTLTISSGVVLTNNGTIKIVSGGSLINNGTIHNNGTIEGTTSGSGTMKDVLTDLMINDIEDQDYCGTEIKPAVTFKDAAKYTENTDYTLTYEYNMDAGNAAVIIRAMGDKLFGEVRKGFTIRRATPAFDDPWTVTGKTYDGKPISITAPKLTGVNNETISTGIYLIYQVKGNDWGWDSTAPTDAGTYIVKASYKGDNNYNPAEKTAEFTITKATPTFAGTWDITGKTYDGNQISGITAPVLTGVNSETISTGIILTYQIKDSGQDLENGAPTDAGTYTVKASYKGDNNYNPAEKTAEFTITKATPTFAGTWDITGKTYDGNQISGITAPVLTGVNSETISTGIQLTYQIKDSGLDWGDTAPTDAGTYTVKASYAGDKNYNTAEKPAEFTIEKVVLTITPESDQILYKDEPILYTVSEGIIGQEKPLNDGKLGLEQVNGDSYKITLGTLGVNADDGKNYTISFSENIQATCFNQPAGDADVNLSEPPTGADGWHTDKNGITFTAPKGFEIALTGSTELKSEPAYGESFIWDTEGEHEVAYNLRRIGTESVYSKSKTIKFDCTPPVHQDGSPAISNLQATFTLADAGSGIASFSYVLDGNAEVEETLADTPHEHSFSLTDKAGKHTFVLKATDVAGNTVTYPDIAFELRSPYVPPVAYYYTVTLPAVEGVTLSRKPGGHTVEESYSFSFTLKLDAEYDKSVPVVTTTRGETIEPDKNGKYVIRNVEEDIDISITGIFRNDDPTANASIQGEVQVKALGHTLYIYTSKEEAVFIYTATGYLLKQQMVTGSTHIGGLPAGIYFVRIKERAYKVMIR